MPTTIRRRHTPYVALDRMPSGRLVGCLVARLQRLQMPAPALERSPVVRDVPDQYTDT